MDDGSARRARRAGLASSDSRPLKQHRRKSKVGTAQGVARGVRRLKPRLTIVNTSSQHTDRCPMLPLTLVGSKLGEKFAWKAGPDHRFSLIQA